MDADTRRVGRVLGTEDSTPLEFWVGIEDGTLPAARRRRDGRRPTCPGPGALRISGLVDMVRARHEGSRFDTDVFLADQGLLPVETGAGRARRAARASSQSCTSRRDRATRWSARPATLATRPCTSTRWRSGSSPASRATGCRCYIDLSFLDGRRGAHVNISGVSGVATKTSYASFLLYALFHSDVLGNEAANTKALIFNVKGEDLLFLDKPNAQPDRRGSRRLRGARAPGRARSNRSGCGRRSSAAARSRSRTPAAATTGVTSYFWTVRDVVRERLLRFLFAEEGDERSQIADLVARVEQQLERFARGHPRLPRVDPAARRARDADGRALVRRPVRADRRPPRGRHDRTGAATSRRGPSARSCAGSTARGFTAGI